MNLTFGYPSKVRDGRSGVDIVSGSDHGAGASRFVSKLNLSSPEDRKLNSNPSLNCRQVSFGLIDCKKDAAEILDLVSDDVNKGMKELVDGKLVGFKDMIKNTRSAIIPRGSTNIQVISPTTICYTHESIQHNTHLTPGLQPSSEYTIWTIVEEFTNFVCGDLAFYATIQGSDGTSTCRCPYCTLTAVQWKLELEDQPPIEPITLPLLERYATLYSTNPKANTFGVKAPPLWLIDPTKYTISVLHIMMGLINKALQELITWIDSNVEMVSEREQIQRNKVVQDVAILYINAQTYHNNTTIIEQSRSEYLLEWRELIQILKRAELQRKNGTLTETPEVIAGWKTRKDECKLLAEGKKAELDVTKKVHKTETAQLKKQKDLLVAMRKSRLLDNTGFDTELEGILGSIANVYKEAYHGGDLNGVCCIRLLDKQKEVINALKIMCTRRREMPRTHNVPCTLMELDSKLESYADLFQALDVTFSRLRTIYPTDDECDGLDLALRVLKRIWTTMAFSVTPKDHILFEHSSRQFRSFQGLVDKGEDFVEKAHQQGMRLKYITSRMSTNFEAKQKSMLAIDWRRTNPNVENEQTKVDSQARRKKRSDVLDGYADATNRKVNIKRIKLERRNNFLERNEN